MADLVSDTSVVDQYVQSSVGVLKEFLKLGDAIQVIDIKLMELWMESLFFQFRDGSLSSVNITS